MLKKVLQQKSLASFPQAGNAAVKASKAKELALDIALELWAVIVVAGAAGAVAAFFQNADSQ